MTMHDRYLAGYRIEELRVECQTCGTDTGVTVETEYGQTTYTPEECPDCGTAWNGSEATEPDEPDPDAAYDRSREDDEEMGVRR